MTQEGIVFNIQRFTIHDGPGLRTELFFKGCPLRCEWCSNPESWVYHIQPGVYRTKCITQKKCGACEEVCPDPSMLIFERGKLSSINREKCINCNACSKACPADAIKQWGQTKTIENCMQEIRKDITYYEHSGGGVTVSGGEPLLQSDFIAELFKACQKEGIHTCCESALHVDWKHIEKILPYTDLIITDIKHMDTEMHKKYTGVDNMLILENIKKITQQNKELILRIAVIPKVNDDLANMEATADFILNELDGQVRTLQLLSFMRLGEEKYESLGMPYLMKGLRFNREAFQKKINNFAAYFNNRGIHCLVGTKEKKEETQTN